MSKHFQGSLANCGDAGLPEDFLDTSFEHTCLKSALIFYQIKTDN